MILSLLFIAISLLYLEVLSRKSIVQAGGYSSFDSPIACFIRTYPLDMMLAELLNPTLDGSHCFPGDCEQLLLRNVWLISNTVRNLSIQRIKFDHYPPLIPSIH